MHDRPSTTRPFSSGISPAPLVLLPGTLCDNRVFDAALSKLEYSSQVVTLAGAASAHEMAAKILANAPQRFALCGFSLGAIVALEVIAQAPERVDRLALIACNPGVLDADAFRSRSSLAQADFLAGETGPHLALLRDMARCTPTEVYAQQTAMTLSRADSRSRLAGIRVRTLVLCGANDRTCPPHMSRAIAAAIPEARLSIIPGAGHYVTLDAPELVSIELAAWLLGDYAQSTEGAFHG